MWLNCISKALYSKHTFLLNCIVWLLCLMVKLSNAYLCFFFEKLVLIYDLCLLKHFKSSKPQYSVQWSCSSYLAFSSSLLVFLLISLHLLSCCSYSSAFLFILLSECLYEYTNISVPILGIIFLLTLVVLFCIG
jgi:hypothetical protein